MAQTANEWRLYTFTNVYISSMQKGIQTAHVVSELFAECQSSIERLDDLSYCAQMDILLEWATHDKTIIVLNGGNQATLMNIHQEMIKFAAANNYPCTMFREDEQSLNGAVTAIGIIIPNEAYNLRYSYMLPATQVPDEFVIHAERSYVEQNPFLQMLFTASLAV